MPTSASTRATTAKRARFYPLQSWREASEGFPMIDVYRWWTPKGANAGNFDLLDIWHAFAKPGVDLLDQWRTDSLHAQAVDLPDLWLNKSLEVEAVDLPHLWNELRADDVKDDQIREWKNAQDHSQGGQRLRVNAMKIAAPETGKWQWISEISSAR